MREQLDLGRRNVVCQVFLFLWLSSTMIDGQQTEFSACLEGTTEFIAVTVGGNFEFARNQCELRSATLARISNEQEHNFVGALIDSIIPTPDRKFWFGKFCRF